MNEIMTPFIIVLDDVRKKRRIWNIIWITIELLEIFFILLMRSYSMLHVNVEIALSSWENVLARLSE